MAEDKKEEAAPKVEEPAGPKKIMGLSIPVFGILVLNAVVMLGGLGYSIYIRLIFTKPAITDSMAVDDIQTKAKQPTEANPTAKLYTEDYPEMTINLRGNTGGKSHFATVEVSIACRNEECIPALKALRAKIEDTIQTVISAHSYTELNTLETKARVKYEIEEQVNSMLADKPVTEIFFSSFIAQ